MMVDGTVAARHTARFTGRLVAPLLGAAIAVAAYLWLDRTSPPFLVTDDGIRDLLLARDCADLGACHTVGSPASLRGFHQGAVWADVLAGVRLLGGDTATQRSFVLALAALATATVFVVVWRWLRPSLALPAALIFAAAQAKDYMPIQLVSGGASAFPNALAGAALLAWGLSAKLRYLAVAALAAGLAINEHVVSLTLLPALFGLAVMARARPTAPLFVAAAIVALVCAVTSSAALRANVLEIGERLPLGWALAGALAALLLCAKLGARYRRLRREGRAWVIGVILVSPFAATALWLVAVQEHHFSLHYLNPVLAPAAVLLAASAAAPFELAARRRRSLRWIPSVAALAIVVSAAGAARPHVGQVSRWSLGEAASLAALGERRGWGFEDLVYRLQAPECRELLVQMSLFAPPPPRRAREHGFRQLQVVRANRLDEIPGNLAPTAAGLVVREIDSWLRPARMRACRLPIGGAAACEAVAAAPARIAGEDFMFLDWSFPEAHSLATDRPYRASWELTVEPHPGESRAVAVLDRGRAECAWHFTAVRRLEVDRPLPARQIAVASTSGDAAVLVVEKRFDTQACSTAIDMRYPPCMFETTLDDPLLALVSR